MSHDLWLLEGRQGYRGKAKLRGLITDRHKRLAQLQQSSKRNPHYQTLERDLIELQEQQLFELFVVVSLQKKPSEINYIPQVIQQFPSKVSARRSRGIQECSCVSVCIYFLSSCLLLSQSAFTNSVHLVGSVSDSDDMSGQA